MSMQEINLYLPEFRPKKEYFSANFTVASSVVFVVVLVFIFFSAKYSNDKFQASVEQLENQAVASSERITEIKSRSPSTNALQLEKRILQLNESIEGRKQVGQIIEWQNLGNAEGFAGVMNGLARHSSTSFALSRIRISAGGKLIELAGETRKAESIPQYLQDLHEEKSFEQIRFGLLSMNSKSSDRSTHKFSLGFETVYDLADE